MVSLNPLVTFESLPIYNISILLLIISGNYLGELFPCRLQKSLSANIYLKHILGYLTIVFFVSLNDKLVGSSLDKLFVNSLILYIIFMLAIKSNITFLYITMALLMTIYIINLKIDILINNGNINGNINGNNDLQQINRLTKAKTILKYLILCTITIGFLLYLGEKKIEYKSKFNYITFLFGKSNCNYSTPTKSITKSFKALFGKY